MDFRIPNFCEIEALRPKGGLDAVDEKGWTKLHFAAADGKKLDCRCLIERCKLDVNAKSKRGETPLHLAVSGGHLDTATYLIERGANVNDVKDGGMAALHIAAKNGKTKLLPLLISKGADVVAVSLQGMPLHVAAFHGKPEAVKILLDSKCDPNSGPAVFWSPLILAILARSLDSVKVLLKRGADPNLERCGMTPLHAAALEFRKEFTDVLLGAGANPNTVDAVGVTPLELALIEKNTEAAIILFPVTTPLPSLRDWSIPGIIIHICSANAGKQRRRKMKESALVVNQKGDEAFSKSNYMDAYFYYSTAGYIFPDDAATVASNRCLCCIRLGFGDEALTCARACVRLKPDCSKSHLREGEAWMLLKNNEKAVEALTRALALDSDCVNPEIMHALVKAMEAKYGV